MPRTTWAIEIEGVFNADNFPIFFETHVWRNRDVDENSSMEVQRAVKQFEIKYRCKIPEGCKIFRGDGSVSFSDQVLDEYEGSERILVGEIASPIFSSVKDLMRFIKDFYPVMSNMTCGIHLHHKPTLGNYSKALMYYGKFKDDYMTFLNTIGQVLEIPLNHRFWHRVNGDEHYCQDRLTLDDVKHQILNENYMSQRYRHVNFCWSKHN
jgi:hypothetical protein